MSKLKIGAKIGALVGFILVVMGAVGLTSILFLRSISSELHEITAEDLPLTKKITQISLHQLKQAVLFERAIRLGERLVDRPGEKAQFDKVVKEFVEISNNTRGR